MTQEAKLKTINFQMEQMMLGLGGKFSQALLGLGSREPHGLSTISEDH